MEKEKTRYTKDDIKCPHCGGNLSDHWGGAGIIRWCDECGSNNPKSPPNVKITVAPHH